jgi:hypothetical protein
MAKVIIIFIICILILNGVQIHTNNLINRVSLSFIAGEIYDNKEEYFDGALEFVDELSRRGEILTNISIILNIIFCIILVIYFLKIKKHEVKANSSQH